MRFKFNRNLFSSISYKVRTFIYFSHRGAGFICDFFGAFIIQGFTLGFLKLVVTLFSSIFRIFSVFLVIAVGIVILLSSVSF